MSQENVSDKVRNLQRQIAHNIKFGQKPPSVRKSEGDECSSDEEEVPKSPLQVLAQVEPEPQDTEAREKVPSATHGVVQYRTPMKSPRTKRPPPPGTIESINLDAIPQSAPRLDNTAAKHKLSVKPKNQRVSRKHRRFTQEFLEVDISAVLQEEAVVQKLAEETGGWREGNSRSHWTRQDQEFPEKSKKQRLHEEEQERLMLQRIQEQEKHRRRDEERRAEELRLEQETMRRKQEEFQRREEEERRQCEEDRRKEEDERRKWEEEQRLREVEERKRHEEEERKKREDERRRAEEERRQQELIAERLRLEEERRKKELEEQKQKEEEEAEKLRLWELEEKHRREEAARLYEEQKRQQEEEAEIKRLADEKKRKEEDKRKRQVEEMKAAEEHSTSSDPEWKRKAEELRWREMEERQRPFTFKVSSGEKQILFQKVNLTPVTPIPAQQGETAADIREGTPGVPDSPTLSSSLYVPHTAILVTGAQLCGTAVNLDQIKDTACKSLLGLSEDKKAFGTPAGKNKTSPDRKSGRTKSLNESSLSVDQSSAAVLAEWASIRSRIFKGGLDGKYQDYPDRQVQSQTTSEDSNEPPFSHTNLRKTMSASAKFSITPARKKFADSNRNSEVFSQDETEVGRVEIPSTDSTPSNQLHSPSSDSKGQNKGGKMVRITDSTEECKFAKDLPSFLVPSLPHGSPKASRSETVFLSQVESEDTDTKDYGDQREQSGDERPSPFGIKLRRTNYSLRFHSEQSTERRKKRYSAGDSFEGVPVPLTSTDQHSDSSAFSEKPSNTTPAGESVTKFQGISSIESRSRLGRNAPSSASHERDKVIFKPPIYQKPATFSKPSDGATPPPSPLPKPNRRTSGEMLSHRLGGPELAASEERVEQKSAPTESMQGHRNGQGDDEPKEKKSFFPSISIPWREKTDRRADLIRKEKPSLQSRHSLDSPRTQEKEPGPLWITLALQKQKGFREQQQSREERKNQREAKWAEKQAKDRESGGLVSPTEGKGNGNSGTPKAQTQENKRPDTLLTRFERRDNLKKANTLPTSVTVEIADSTPSPPAAKDITKRFPPNDTAQVSTEPAWLALAKRKAKAWSDCPQIIK
ncbi:capping protein inhibiting regulator of actin dynamics isoform 1-T3 [Clarias gariepinus]|uniref:capping protein inhibiting regulator of actin dynamics n=1 Tax=Clarias gariepinus TaxID=13013 RepID=UPI00234C273E|nr:capping protein inhibiting regulator of actin dynamics [Clarias gariepinus]XP_053344537.1 capping protein inhibiting regulator of actin dynamics [Clarias gariepinus]XP_053344538.1 capping protein inhibiting regulator of actin dynamics [Clarias gariepinus]